MLRLCFAINFIAICINHHYMNDEVDLRDHTMVYTGYSFNCLASRSIHGLFDKPVSCFGLWFLCCDDPWFEFSFGTKDWFDAMQSQANHAILAWRAWLIVDLHALILLAEHFFGDVDFDRQLRSCIKLFCAEFHIKEPCCPESKISELFIKFDIKKNINAPQHFSNNNKIAKSWSPLSEITKPPFLIALD